MEICTKGIPEVEVPTCHMKLGILNDGIHFPLLWQYTIGILSPRVLVVAHWGLLRLQYRLADDSGVIMIPALSLQKFPCAGCRL
jgi:hypothetical protein